MTTGTTGHYLDSGWIVGGGLDWKPDPTGPFSLLAELHYSRYGATEELLRLGNQQQNTVRIDDGDGEIWGLNVNGVYRFPLGAHARGYITAGIGEYYRSVELTQTVLLAGYYCDPWWGICYQGIFPGDALVQDEATTRFAWNAGLGVEFPLDTGTVLFVDLRYHQVQTGEATEFIPLQFGIRF
jgi:hypothetical protein